MRPNEVGPTIYLHLTDEGSETRRGLDHLSQGTQDKKWTSHPSHTTRLLRAPRKIQARVASQVCSKLHVASSPRGQGLRPLLRDLGRMATL